MAPSHTSTPRGSRSSPRQSASASASAPSTPRSARSARSKPAATASTPLKQSTTPAVAPATPASTRSGRSIKQTSKVTSPYFAKNKAVSAAKGRSKAKKAQTSNGRGKAKAKVEDGDEDGEESPTGMTESQSPSSSDDAGSEDDFDPSSDDEEQEEEGQLEESEESEVDSDDLDNAAYGGGKRKNPRAGGAAPKGGNRKKARISTSSAAANGQRGKGGKGGVRVEGYEDEDENDAAEVELEDGQEIAGRIYPAPKTGLVPPGQISQNTLNFLKNLQIPERNDRDWFRSHEPAFRQAEKEWQAFVGLVQMKFHKADDEVPILPPKDIIHRIYRDVRFSSDKTPYKKSFSLTTSRGGRKGLWAGYHLSISPNDRSILACGIWQPGKNEMATIRHNLLADPERFRREINKRDFVRFFGEGTVHPKGERRNVFGHEDQLKVAPKLEGVDRNHKDIDLLKLRTISVVHHFTDGQVIDEDFQDTIKEVLVAMAPFVHLLNDYIALPPDANDDNDNDNDQDANADEEIEDDP